MCIAQSYLKKTGLKSVEDMKKEEHILWPCLVDSSSFSSSYENVEPLQAQSEWPLTHKIAPLIACTFNPHTHLPPPANCKPCFAISLSHLQLHTLPSHCVHKLAATSCAPTCSIAVCHLEL